MLMKILCLQLRLHNCRTSYLPNGKSTPTCGVDDAKISFQLKIQNLVKSYLQLLACVNLDDLGLHRYNSSNSAYTSHFFRRLQVSGSWNECHGSAARDQPCCGFSGYPLEEQSKNDKLIRGDSPSKYLLLENC